MTLPKSCWAGVLLLTALCGLQRPFRVYPSLEPYDDVALPGDWQLTDAQAAKLREYLLRGGFLMLDDFWGTEEWNRFEESMQRVFPDRPIVEIDDRDAIFHTIYNLDDRYQIPGEWALARGTTYRNDGQIARWRGIYDDRN